MALDESQSPRARAQELIYDAMESDDERKAAQLCRQALEVYPDCADALAILAEIESRWLKDYVQAMRRAVEAGRRDLGEEYIQRMKGEFWLDLDTRPYMRALERLAGALLECGRPDHVDEAICLYEQMLALNPNDNQGVRDPLAACYLQRRRYNDAANLLKRYEKDWTATACWARVLLACATGNEERAAMLLGEARKQNAHVEQYLTGQKRRPRTRPDYYSPGQDTEAVYCADTLREAWKKHPKAKEWLKQQCSAEAASSGASPRGDDQPDVEEDSALEGPLRFPVPMNESGGNDLATLKNAIAEAYRERFEAIVERTDAFCQTHLNDEYKQFCRKMAADICQQGSPARKGNPESWAAGVVYALGRVNFLMDPGQDPHMKADDIATGLGVSPTTMHAKAKSICEWLDLMPLDPAWSLPSKMDDNPLVWVVEVNGLLVDIRMAPREVQVVAHEKGLIPYIPADRDGS